MFHTLQSFMLHSKGVTYVLMALVLVGMVGLWSFLLGRGDEERERFDVEHGNRKD